MSLYQQAELALINNIRNRREGARLPYIDWLMENPKNNHDRWASSEREALMREHANPAGTATRERELQQAIIAQLGPDIAQAIQQDIPPDAEVTGATTRRITWASGLLWDLNLMDTQVSSLPKGLIVSGDLDLRRTPIASLPEGLTVGGDLLLGACRTTTLPKDLTVGGSIHGGSNITSVQEGLCIGGYIHVGDRLTEEGAKGIFESPGISDRAKWIVDRGLKWGHFRGRQWARFLLPGEAVCFRELAPELLPHYQRWTQGTSRCSCAHKANVASKSGSPVTAAYRSSWFPDEPHLKQWYKLRFRFAEKHRLLGEVE